MSIQHVTDPTFEQAVHASDVVVIDFWAPWCGPCKAIAPVLEELSGELPSQVTIAKVNVDDNPESAAKYGVMSIPTLLLFKNGQPVDQAVGARSKQALRQWIDQFVQ